MCGGLISSIFGGGNRAQPTPPTPAPPTTPPPPMPIQQAPTTMPEAPTPAPIEEDQTKKKAKVNAKTSRSANATAWWQIRGGWGY